MAGHIVSTTGHIVVTAGYIVSTTRHTVLTAGYIVATTGHIVFAAGRIVSTAVNIVCIHSWSHCHHSQEGERHMLVLSPLSPFYSA